MADVIRFTVPLPPPALRGNSRAHWAKRKKAADEYSEDVWAAFNAVPTRVDDCPHCTGPWETAHVTYVWKYAGVAPDHSNLGQHTKYLQDIICCAPKLSPAQAQKYKRWHLGIVENDAGIEAEYHMEKVAHRKDEAVEVTIRRVDE